MADSGAAPKRQFRWGALLKIVFGLVGVLFLALAFQQTWDRSRDVPIPDPMALALAAVAALAALTTAGQSWITLFEGDGSTRHLLRAFYASQIGKYIPGGIWQPAGQAGLAVGTGVHVARAATLLPVHLLTQLVAAAFIGGLIAVFGRGLPLWLRLGALGALLALMLLNRDWMAAIALRIRRWRGWDVGEDHVPSQRAILHSFAWSVVTTGLSGAGFAVLLGSLSSADSFLQAVTGLALAWAVGFVAVPFPSGIGVREVVLVAALGSSTAVIIAASIAHRLLQMAGEVVMIGVTAWRASRAKPAMAGTFQSVARPRRDGGGSLRIVYFGSYDARRHPRNQVLLDGLRSLGESVEEVNEPLGFSTDERVELLRRPWRLAVLGARVIGVWVRLWRQGRQLEPPDAVIVGYMGHLDVHLARRIWPDTTIALDHMISVADTARDRRVGRPAVLGLLARIDRAAVDAADLPFVDTAEHLELLTPAARKRAEVVPIGAPRFWFREARPTDSDRLQVVFFGLFTPLQGTLAIARAMASLAHEPIDFHVFGRGQEYQEARAIAAENSHIIWEDWVASDELPDRVAACHVCLGIFGTGPKAQRVVPNKVFQGAAAGCAIVTSGTEPQIRILGDAALYTPPGDAEALASTLAGLAQDRDRVEALRQAARTRAREAFTPEAVVRPLRERLLALRERPE